jgi:uncharacterized protein (TIGR02757 family)
MNAPAKQRQLALRLKPFLDTLVERYHCPEYLGSDPLCMVHKMPDKWDQQYGALFSALLAYGNVKQINASLNRLFAAMNWRPAQFVKEFEFKSAKAALAGFQHRFTDAEDVLCLCYLLSQLARCDSLEDTFLRGVRKDEGDYVEAASRFFDTICSQQFAPWFDRNQMLAKSSFKHLLPRANKGSACKRVHLFLRWMVRPADGVDLGLWNRVSPAGLLIPVDTHILRIGRNLGLTSRTNASLLTAREITAVLKTADCNDPVRYDFALCRLGILKACPAAESLQNCIRCELHDVCRRRAQLSRSSRTVNVSAGS